MSFANEQEQVLIREHQGRVVSITSNIPRPIEEYEKEIAGLKEEIALTEKLIEEKNAEIEECNKIMTNQTFLIDAQTESIIYNAKEIQSLREKLNDSDQEDNS